MMELEQEIRKAVKQIIMEEANNLSVRAALHEKIEAAGFDRDEIRKLIKETADSYFRSAMNGSVENEIRRLFMVKINDAASNEVKNALGSEWTGWRGRDKVRDAIQDEIKKQIALGFEVEVAIKRKEK